MVWKVEGLSEYDARRPITPTGTNLLGLVKHLASVELGYFGDTFGRPSGIELPWHADDADPNDDLYLTADETAGVGARPLPDRLGARGGRPSRSASSTRRAGCRGGATGATR